MIDIDIILDLLSLLIIIAVVIISVTVVLVKRRKTKKVQKRENEYLIDQLTKVSRSLDYSHNHYHVYTQKGTKENKLDD